MKNEYFLRGVLVIAGGLAAIVCGLLFLRPTLLPTNESILSLVHDKPRTEHQASFLEPAIYDRYFSAAALSDAMPTKDGVISGVIPHHLVAGVYMAKFFNVVADQNPPVVVLIGPNHPQSGRNSVVTSLGVWKTPYGAISVDQKIVQKLVEQDLAVVDEKVIGSEHAIGADVPFVKHAWPNAKIVPLILKENTPTSTLEMLAKTLTDILPEKSLVLASVDFSHYLPQEVADFHDERSRNVLAVGDLERVTKLEVDSPKSLYFLLYYNQLKAAERFTLLSSTNSGVISENKNLAETTSHIIGYYTAGKPVETPVTTVQFFGDMMLDRNVAKAFGDKGLDYLFENLKAKENRFFYGMDYLIANLEGPFAPTRVPTTKSIAFRFDPKLAAQLKNYGFNAVSLANNHTLDMGWANVDFTHATLDTNEVGHFGDQIREGKEFTWFSTPVGSEDVVGFIGLNTTDHPLDMEKVRAAIQEAKTKTRYVIVFMHWGVEYERISHDTQRTLARQLIDLGVNAVIGAHPHVVQEMELYKGKPIFYSLGNFIFDQYFSEETQQGLGVGLVLKDGDVNKIYTFPLQGKKSQVELMKGKQRENFLDLLKNNSRLGSSTFSGGMIVVTP